MPERRTFVRSTQPHGPHGTELDDERWEERDESPPLTDHSAAQRVLVFTQNQRDEIRDLGDQAGSLSGEGSHQTNYLVVSESAPSSPGSAESTSASNEPDTESPGSASPTRGDDQYSPPGSPESPATETLPTSARVHDAMGLAPTLQAERSQARGGTQGPLIFSVEGSPARTSPSPDDAQGSTEPDPASSSSSHGSQISLFQPMGLCSLRTFPDFFPPTADAISPSFSRRWPTSGFTTSPGECWTADTSESPSDGAGCSCSLADVLEETVAPRYFLSPRAAAGILRRAERRGKTLPAHLEAALAQVATGAE